MNFDIKRFLMALLLCMLVMMGWQWYMVKTRGPATAPADRPQDSPSTQDTTAAGPAGADRTGPAGAEAIVSPPADPDQWRVRPQTPAEPVELGQRQPTEQGYKALIALDAATAAVDQVLLNEYKKEVTDKHTGYPLLSAYQSERHATIRSFGFEKIKIKGRHQEMSLASGCWRRLAEPLDTPDGQAVRFLAAIEQPAGTQAEPVLEVIKSYRWDRNSYELVVEVSLINQTTEPLEIQSLGFWGPVGLLREDPRSDRRQVIAAYGSGDDAFKLETEKVSLDKEKNRHKILEKPGGGDLKWIGVSNKFFASILRPLPQESDPAVHYLDTEAIEAVALANLDPDSLDEMAPAVRLRLIPPKPLAAGEQSTYSLRVYLGPISKDVFAQAPYDQLYYNKLIYSGSCSFCAFDWLTDILLWLLQGMYRLIGNYGIAIIILVLLVRLCLHPITKKSQVNMQKMSKIGPKMQELREKYGADRQEFQRRQFELMKEQGMTGGMLLGCLPMLLQMPIWIALFTAVDSNVAVRHHGLFPASWFPESWHWQWLTDLSAPDRLIPFAWFGLKKPVPIPLIGGLDAFNLLPILLTIAMYLQTKKSTSATMATANPQAAQQQKMMLYLMPIMMLVFFFTAPSGLNLYIMASTFGGLIEQHFIRKHLKLEEARAAEQKVAVTSKVSDKFGPKKKKPKLPRRYY
ncbi:MAG: membrane protein insertase YidC [Sedimentisphaerales bacterium]|nr:membrane protein insertase YidC [Sedimentisphaerales bacterium]